MRGRALGAAAGLGLAFGLGCGGLSAAMNGTPPPANHQDLVGAWTAPGTTLNISPGGRLDYERQSGSVHTELHGGVTQWSSDEFVVMGVSTFHIDTAPHQTGSGWEMTLDGVTYSR